MDRVGRNFQTIIITINKLVIKVMLEVGTENSLIMGELEIGYFVKSFINACVGNSNSNGQALK